MTRLVLLFLSLTFSASLLAQVGIGTQTPNASSILDLTSDNKGILIPRMTSAQRQLIPSPAQGLLVFDITTNSFWYKNPTIWVELQDSINTEVHRVNGNKLFTALSDSLGIGTDLPGNKVDILGGLSRSGTHAKGRALYVTANSLPDTLGVEFRHDNGTQGIGLGYNTVYASGSATSQDLGMKAKGPNGDLLFSAGGAQRLRIKSNGNVGIGTASPLQKLQVTGNTIVMGNIGINTTTLNFPLSFPESTGDKISLWGDTGAHFGFGIGASLLQVHTNSSSSDIGFGYGSSASFTEVMHIKGNGNVGIGLTAPLAMLDIARGTASEGTARFKGTMFHSNFNYATDEHTYIRGGKTGSHIILNEQTGLGNVGVGLMPTNKLDVMTGSGRTGLHPTGRPLYVTGDLNEASNGIEFRHNNGTQGIGFGFATIYAAGSLASQNLGFAAKGPAGNLIFTTNGSERMRISDTGNMMIGTTDGALGHILSVAGKIAAEEILVDLQTDWPDYVFEESYHLPSLDDLKTFIEENNHLPGVPSASQVQEQGIYLGEINAVLLEKIEELTLYLLQQDERIRQLENCINAKQ